MKCRRKRWYDEITKAFSSHVSYSFTVWNKYTMLCVTSVTATEQRLSFESIGYTKQKTGHIVLKGVNWVHNGKISDMLLKGVNCVDNDKIRSHGLERSQLGTQYKNQVKWSWKESIRYTMIKLGHMVLKEVNCVHNAKIRSYGLERNQLGTQCKNQVIWS